MQRDFGLTLFFGFTAVFSTAAMAFLMLVIVQISDANKAQQRALVCFDAAGKVTLADNFKECRRVAIREL